MNFAFKELIERPKGSIRGIFHTGNPQFIPWGNDPRHGRLVIPAKDIFQERVMKNLIVDKASILIAKRMAPGVVGSSWGAGINYLEVGTGVGTGTQQAPQAETSAATALRTALARKAITAWTCLDTGGNATASETNIIQLSTTFNETEAVGALTEMGLFGGDASATPGTGYMFNFKTFSVWNKQNVMKLTIAWNITF